MTDDIVTRLQLWEHEFDWGWTLPNEAAAEIERLRNALAEQTIIHEVQKTNTLSEIERLRKERDRWRSIANQLVNGAERQIDDLREIISESNGCKVATIPRNVHWIAAWRRHDEAVHGE